jgi:hypothetical protein
VELFVNKGLRVNGNLGSVLLAQLVTSTSKKSTDDRGWYAYLINLTVTTDPMVNSSPALSNIISMLLTCPSIFLSVD